MDMKFLALAFCFLAALGNPSPVRRSTVRPQPGLCSLQGRAPHPCQRWHKIDRNGCCRPCKCQRGKGKQPNTQDPCKEKCKPCIAKVTFNEQFDYFCKSCRVCGANEFVVQHCEVYSNTVCQAVNTSFTMNRENSGELGRTRPRNSPKYTTNISAVPTSRPTTLMFSIATFGTMSVQSHMKLSAKEIYSSNSNAMSSSDVAYIVLVTLVVIIATLVAVPIAIIVSRRIYHCRAQIKSPARRALIKSPGNGQRMSHMSEDNYVFLDTFNPVPSENAHPPDPILCDAPNILTEEIHREAITNLTQDQTHPNLPPEPASLGIAANNTCEVNSSVSQMLPTTISKSSANLKRQSDLHQESSNEPGIQTVKRLDVAQCETIPKILKKELGRYKFIDSMEIWNNRLRVHVCLNMCEGKTNEELEEMVKSLVEVHGNIAKTDCDVVFAEAPVKLTFYNYPPSSGAKLNLESFPGKYMTLGAYATTGTEGEVYLLSAGHGVSNENEDLFSVHLTNGKKITCVCQYLVRHDNPGNLPWVDITALKASGLKINCDCAANYVEIHGLKFLKVCKSDVKQLFKKVMYKIGATTGRTESVIVGRDCTLFHAGIENAVLLKHTYEGEIFCKEGDSGAIVRKKEDDSAVLMIFGEHFSRATGEKTIMAFKLCDGLDALKEMSGSEWRLLVDTDVETKQESG